jgi:hypothetical protein
MYQAARMSVLCISLIAGSVVSWQETLVAESSSGEGVRIPPPVPTGDTQATIGPSTDGGSFAICENEGPSLVDSRAKVFARVPQLARASLRHRSTSQLPPVLWARTFSVSLLQHNVLLQI